MKKRKLPPRTSEEAAGDILRVLRYGADIEHHHWVSGVGPGQCATCNAIDSTQEAWEMDPLEVGALYDVSSDAVAIGMAKARAATKMAEVIELFPEILEPEHEDLDLMGENGLISGRLRIVEDQT